VHLRAVKSKRGRLNLEFRKSGGKLEKRLEFLEIEFTEPEGEFVPSLSFLLLNAFKVLYYHCVADQADLNRRRQNKERIVWSATLRLTSSRCKGEDIWNTDCTQVQAHPRLSSTLLSESSPSLLLSKSEPDPRNSKSKNCI
jgi:hypothetical protein